MTKNEPANQLGYDKIASWIQSIVDGLLGQTTSREAQSAERQQLDAARSTRLFAEALHGNSNLELDWLWYAANMTRDIERRYCLQRALEINPHSSLARSALAKLAPADATEAPSSASGAPAYDSSPRS